MNHIVLSFCLVATTVAACSSKQAAVPSSEATRAEVGEQTFHSYCSSCHGMSGVGDGPVAQHLTTPPADLTEIAKRNNGRFDRAQVARFIDGRARLTVHGSPEMPAWGRRYDDRREDGFRDETLLAPGTILTLVDYLASIQEP